MTHLRAVALRLLLLLGVLGAAPVTGHAQSTEAQRAVLVTGASSGIGRKITERLASAGFFVYAGARAQKDLDDLNAIKNVQAIRLDVTVPSDIASAVATVTKAGRGLHGVVNISSLNGIVASPMIGPYSMSKHAIEAYGDGLAAELARFGVRVSLIEPGNYRSEIGRNLLARWDSAVVKGSRFEPQIRSALNSMKSFENNPEPDDVAEAVLDALSNPNPKMRYLPTPALTDKSLAPDKPDISAAAPHKPAPPTP